jgi:hypothetical protein
MKRIVSYWVKNPCAGWQEGKNLKEVDDVNKTLNFAEASDFSNLLKGLCKVEGLDFYTAELIPNGYEFKSSLLDIMLFSVSTEYQIKHKEANQAPVMLKVYFLNYETIEEAEGIEEAFNLRFI